jgi:hypothetical protein
VHENLLQNFIPENPSPDFFNCLIPSVQGNPQRQHYRLRGRNSYCDGPNKAALFSPFHVVHLGYTCKECLKGQKGGEESSGDDGNCECEDEFSRTVILWGLDSAWVEKENVLNMHVLLASQQVMLIHSFKKLKFLARNT